MKANRDWEILVGLLSQPTIPVISITWRLGRTEEARREIQEYIERWPTPNTNLDLLVKGLLGLASTFNRVEAFVDSSPQRDGWNDLLRKHVKLPYGIETGTTLFHMSTPTTKQPRYMGYFNHHGYPICAMMGNRKLDLEAGQPVINSRGEPVADHPDLDVLVQQGILKRIPLGDQKWEEVFNQTRRLSGVRMATVGENNERAKTVATNMGLVHNQADLPPGAEYVTEGRTQVIMYQGRKFTSVAALNAYLASQNNG